jgi:protein Tex
MNHADTIAQTLSLRPLQVTAVIDLLDAGNTIPFIARYRKEATYNLDEDQIRQIAGWRERLHNLDQRRQTILASIEGQGKLTPDLAQRLNTANSLTELEDLYLPYKPKRRTRASMARDKGLEPLAELLVSQPRTRESLDSLTQPFLNNEVATPDDAWAGARDIVAEAISDTAEIRQAVREKALKFGQLRVEKIDKANDERGTYRIYYEFQNRIDRLKPYQILAINRGETEGILRVRLNIEERDWLLPIRQLFRPDPRSPLADQLQQAIEDAAQRLLLPAIERDVRRQLSETAESHAIHVFADNLRGLLTQPPLAGQTILAIDPGFRTGSKVAVVDPTGKVLDTATIYPHPPQKQLAQSRQLLSRLRRHHGVTLIAIGNGTASRETEQLVAEWNQDEARDAVPYLIVNEAGASVYSASPLARQELPDLDVTLRGAVSIARRVQDPLAELVKIDPKSIGVGLYQHDVNQTELARTLAGVVESVVNQVGVDLNTASPALLTHVAGIGPKLAQRIVAYRDANGRFTNRDQLREVSGLGPKAFEQAAGFLRVRDGDNPLDASAIHPESYGVATAVLAQANLSPVTPLDRRDEPLAQLRRRQPLDQLAAQLNTGRPTLEDIFEQLIRPGRDPREDAMPPVLRSDVLGMEDLHPGMVLKGTVLNVVDFGAFIDIGVKQDGLLHVSQIPRHTSLTVGNVIDVTIKQVEIERGRISLSWTGDR